MVSYLDGEATANGASAEIQLVTISAAGLLNGDKQTQNDLFDACKSLGFFYLDCRDHPSKSTTSLVDRISAMALDFYDLPLPSKEDWAELSFDEVKGRPFAYKPAGKQEGSVKGKKDGWEGLIIMETPMAQLSPSSPMPGPKVLQDSVGLILETQGHLGELSRAIVAALSQSLGLTDNRSLTRYHPMDISAPTDLEILKYLPYTPGSEKVGHIPHTDLGSISMVFAEVGGLQVFHPIKEEWMFVPPKPGHAVCNIGDSMEFFSGNILRSSLHRVIPYKQDSEKIRLSVIHFLRPSGVAEFVGADGRQWKVADWNTMKHKQFYERQHRLEVVTRREEQNDFWTG
ncbi:unnamed protein product [Penicillium pancosmium]